MIGWATNETVQSARRTQDSDGWRYPQDCRIHKRRQTAGLAQRVDVLHPPHLATDAIVALLLRPRGGVSWAAGIGPPPCQLGRASLATKYSPDRKRFSVSAVAAWQQRGNKRIGQILRVVKTETCPGLLRNLVRRHEGKLPHIGMDVVMFCFFGPFQHCWRALFTRLDPHLISFNIRADQ